ncbi:hypothetical protein [Vibrio sp. WXL210]|uniref:hypothetical protein n=1 Tax=Vibrio sp. WXL210 TaxID=3450709 RepID=UPI003EC5307C
MKAKKALKKLKKSSQKALKSQSIKQLDALKSETQVRKGSTERSASQMSAELRQVANQAAKSALSELATPLNPLLSWFNEGGIDWPTQTHGQSAPTQTASVVSRQTGNPTPSVKSIVHLPLKSPPCKRCPALSNGVCKCAAKKFKQIA